MKNEQGRGNFAELNSNIRCIEILQAPFCFVFTIVE